MRLTFAGCGSAFYVGEDNYQSNILLTVKRDGSKELEPPRHLLIDCGSDARFSLPRIGVRNPRDIDAIYITHTHADHIGGLEWLALNCRYGPSPRRPRLILPQELREFLWNSSLAGGLMYSEEGPSTLESYFDVTTVDADGSFTWEGLQYHTVPRLHVESGPRCMTSHGLFFRTAGMGIYISSDVKLDPELHTRPYAQQADLIFHDCETGPRSGVHPSYADLRTLPLGLRRRMWLYHYSPGPLPDARADGFRGFVRRGQVFDFERPETLIEIAG